MRTPMLPFVDIVRCNGPLADKPVNTTLTSITDILDFYGRDLAADSGHALMIRETASSLNLTEKADASESTIGDRYVPDTRSMKMRGDLRPGADP